MLPRARQGIRLTIYAIVVIGIAVTRANARGALPRAAARLPANGFQDTARPFLPAVRAEATTLSTDDYASLDWFHSARAASSPQESTVESVQSTVPGGPYDDWTLSKIAPRRAQRLDPSGPCGMPEGPKPITPKLARKHLLTSCDTSFAVGVSSHPSVRLTNDTY
jgi:hypothetical protein